MHSEFRFRVQGLRLRVYYKVPENNLISVI